MNLKGKINTVQNLKGKQAIAGGSGGSTPAGDVTWNQVKNKPFSTVDTAGGLTIYDNTLGIDTLDHIATIDYVDQQIADIPTPTVNIDNKSIINGPDGLQLNQPFGEWRDVIYGWKPDFEYNGSAWVHTLTQDEKNYCSNELIPALLLGFRFLIITWSFGNYGEYIDYTVTQDGTTVTISLDAYHSIDITADDMTVTGFAPIDFTLLIEQSSVTLEQYNIEAGETSTEQRIHQISKTYIPDPDWDDITNKPTFATVATTGSYNDLSNKPTIPSIDGLATETYVNDAIAAIDIPEDVSELNNDAGYITDSVLEGYATETYVDNAVDGITTTLETDYATKAELTDVDDEIPHADNVTIIDNNGVWSAVSAGVDIDNKSIIKNQDDELQTAVPAYRELASETDEGLYFDTFTYPAGTDLDAILNTGGTHITLDTSNDAYTVIAVINGVMYTGNWTASPNSSYEYGGGGKWKVTSPITGNYELYWQWRNNTEYKIHIYMGGQYISTGNVSDLIFISNNSGDTLLSQLETLQLDSYIGTIKTYNYHKIPAEYLDIDTTITVEDLIGNGTNGVLRGGDGISLGQASSGSTKWVNVAQKYDSVVSFSGDSGVVGRLESAFVPPDYNYSRTSQNLSLTYKTDGTLPMFESYSFNPSNWKSFIISLSAPSFYVSMLGDPVNKIIYGCEKFCDSYEFFTGDGSTPHNGKVYPNNQTYIIFINPKWTGSLGGTSHYQLRGNIFASTTADALFTWNTLQPYSIPIDNETLEITNGKIKTAIPAPPTTDGTYTLQATVSNGAVSYSWI